MSPPGPIQLAAPARGPGPGGSEGQGADRGPGGLRGLWRGAPALAALLVWAPACGSADDLPRRPEASRDAGSEGGFPVRLVDAGGDTLRLDAPPPRVVSLVPSATQTLQALGQAHRLVGRTDFDTLPPLDTLPSVGGGLHPSIERLVSLEPDLVIRFAGASDRRTPDRLDELGIPHLAVRPDGIDDVRSVIRTLGRATGASSRADSLVARIDSTLARVRRAVEGRPRPAVAFVLGGSPAWVAGPGTFVHQLVEAAGGRNAFGDLGELYGPVSAEAFVARPIDVVLAVEGADVRLPVEGVPLRRVGARVQTPGPDLGRAALEIARLLHPGALP